jgi:shikimate kinase
MAIFLRNIVLIGMPGSGKSTVGALLAKRLGYKLIDTDRMMVDAYGKSLPELIADMGVEGFRLLEGRTGERLACDQCVIATGGSMVYSEGAMRHLRASGVTVWLDAASDELRRRIAAAGDRGIAAERGVTVEQLDAERRPLYEKYADIHVFSDGTGEAVAARIEHALKAWSGEAMA